MDDRRVAAFWAVARPYAKFAIAPGETPQSMLEMLQPPAWSFEEDPSSSYRPLELVLAGAKTAMASALWDYEDADEPLPSVGTLSIILDGAGRPRALIVTTRVEVRPFAEVDEEHAHLEGRGDRGLAQWREEHERFFTEHASAGHTFTPEMPVVLERFRVLYQRGVQTDLDR